MGRGLIVLGLFLVGCGHQNCCVDKNITNLPQVEADPIYNDNIINVDEFSAIGIEDESNKRIIFNTSPVRTKQKSWTVKEPHFEGMWSIERGETGEYILIPAL